MRIRERVVTDEELPVRERLVEDAEAGRDVGLRGFAGLGVVLLGRDVARGVARPSAQRLEEADVERVFAREVGRARLARCAAPSSRNRRVEVPVS